MAGHSSREIRIVIDESAKNRLEEFGAVAIRYPGDEFDAIQLVYRDEDLDKELSDPTADQLVWLQPPGDRRQTPRRD